MSDTQDTAEGAAQMNKDALLPCPFCGGNKVSVAIGSTFRWRVAQCDSCGAATGEVRCQTSGEPRDPEAWEAQAIKDAHAEWNRRALTADAGMERAAGMLDAAEAYYRTPDEGETDEEIKLNAYAAEALRVQAMIIRTNAIRAASAQVNAEGLRREKNPPFSNCKYQICDLPGQCVSEGKCHHPSAPDAGQVVCTHDWHIWPETDGYEQRCSICKKYRTTPPEVRDAAMLRAAGSRHDG